MSFIGGRLPKIREEDKEKDDGEIGTQHLDALGNWFSGTQYGQRFIEGQERNAKIQQELMSQPGLFGWINRMQNTPNETELKILENINKLSPVDERITTPATYLAIGALGGKGVPKLYNKLNQSTAAHRIAHEAGQNVGRNVTRIKKDVGWAKDQFQYATGQKLRPMHKKPNPFTDIAQVIDGPGKIVQRAKKIYQYHAGAIPFSEAMRRARELPDRSGSEYWHQDSELALKKGGITDPDRNDTTKLMYTSSGGPIVPDDNIQNARSIRPAFESHLTQGGRAMRLNYKALMNNKTFSQNYSRLVSGAWVTNWASGLPVSRGTTPSRQTAHNNLRQELLTGFEEDYGEAMERLEISRSDIDLDHKLTLIQSTGAYHNTARNSPLYNKIQEIALRRGYTPGDARANLELIDPESHRIKTRFFNDLHGLHTHNNMKYWNGLHRDTGKTRFKIMDESHKSPEGEALHLEVVEDYFDHVDRGTAILSDAQAVWKANNMTGILPEEISEELFKVVIDSDEAYTPSSLKATVESITESEIEKYKIVKKVLEIEKELENLNMLTSPETILPEDSAYVKELKQQLIKLKKVRKSTWFKNYLKELEIEYESGQTGLDLNDYQRVIEEELRPDRIDE